MLSGGSGTRLWPLSTSDLPKQFAPLIAGEPLFTRTLERLKGLPAQAETIVVAGSTHLPFVQSSTAAAGTTVAAVLLEPTGRNTAPAAIAAALVADPDDIMVILPSDHLVTDGDGFRTAVATAARYAAGDAIVTFGVVPTRAETGYGYIEIGDPVDGAFRVRRFKEKPGRAEAARMVSDGRHVWNSGMFVTSAATLTAEARLHCPGILDAVTSSLPDRRRGVVSLGEGFEHIEAISLDHAIMEKTDKALVVPVDVGWDDIGSYRSLLQASERDENGNHLDGDVIIHDVRGSFVKATSRLVAVAGMSDIVVVETPETVLVVPLHLSQEVRDLGRRAERG